MKKKIITIISIVVIIIGLILIWQGKKRASQNIFEVVEAKIGAIAQEITATGTVKPAKEIELEFSNQGKIKEILVKKGERVIADQPLIKLDQVEFNIQILEANAAVEVVQARLDKVLAGASQEDIQVYETAVANAKITLANKKQALTDVKTDTESDLAQAYEKGPNILNDACVKADDALHKQIDDLFSNDDSDNPQLTFITSDSQAETDAEWQRRTAGYELEKLQQETINLAINELDQALSKARQHLVIIRNSLTSAAKALNSAILSKDLTSSDLSAYKTNLTTARTNVNTALTNITNQKQTIAATKISNQTNINTAQAAVDTAQSNLKTVQDQLVLKKAAPAQADLSLAKAQLKQARASLLYSQEKLNQSVLVAPIEGTIVKIDAEIGEMTRTGQAPITLIGLQEMEIKVDIYEEDAVKIKIGNPVDIALVAFPDKVFQGKLVAIEPAEKIIEQIVYYETTIGFEEIPEGLKQGMTADLTIKTAFRENVLIIPKEAIQKKNGKTIVKVLGSNLIEEQEIELGIEGKEGMMEVISGLEENEQIIIK